MDRFILTTTNSIEGKKVIEYKGIIFGEIVVGINFLKDFAAGLTNIFGGRSGSYENEIVDARQNALNELRERAIKLGCNAVVGVKLDYETLGEGGTMVMVTASGTGVIVEE